MLTKIYLAVFFLAILAMSVILFVQLGWLENGGFSPQIIERTYDWWDNVNKLTLWITSLIMLILANAILWSYRSSWALWTTFLYFAVFTLVNGLWTSEKLYSFQKANKLPEKGFILSGLASAGMVILAGVGVYLNNMVVKKMTEGIHGNPEIDRRSDAEPESASKAIEPPPADEPSPLQRHIEKQ